MLAEAERSLEGAIPCEKQPAQAIAGRATLTKTLLDQPALSSEHLRREFAAVLARHGALHALDDGGDGAPVVRELLGAVLDFDVRPAADVFVVGRLVRILEPAPSADIVDEDDLEVGGPGLDLSDQTAKAIATLDPKTALPGVLVGADDPHAMRLGLGPNGLGLVLGGVPLVFGRHADILGGPPLRVG